MPIYDIAISFAGEDRPVAEELASSLVTKGLNVFYDEYEQANLWGKDLYVHLSKIYKDEAKYCLMLVSEHYAKKQWTNHERRAAQARAFLENREYILPLRLDDAAVDGVLDTIGYLDYRKMTIEKLVETVVEKILDYNKKNGITYELVRVEDVFLKQGIVVTFRLFDFFPLGFGESEIGCHRLQHFFDVIAQGDFIHLMTFGNQGRRKLFPFLENDFEVFKNKAR